jgi:phenylacetate-CoA ligase
VDGLSSEYQVVIEHMDGKDNMTLRVETRREADKIKVSEEIQLIFKQKVGIRIQCECLNLGDLPRSEKKSKRVFDYRDK